MLSVTRRPRGHRVSTTAITTYSISSDGYGNAIISGGTGLQDGDYILITNSFTSYNGFWYISGYGPSTFRIYNYSGGTALDYTQSQSNVTIYRSIKDIDYSCVHLPIMYELSNNRFPANTLDTTRYVNAFYNDGGYIKITVSGAITAYALDWLYFSNVGVDGLNGPIQILTAHSTTQFTINASYALASGSVYTYASATCVRYYNNYTANIKVYAGLISGHIWSSLKPIELIAELSIRPDTNNKVMVNISDIIKEKIDVIRNRPNYDSMPYDVDRFAQFYISYAESYDESNGVSVTTTTGSYTTDSFNGIAVDSKNEFKNRYSGYLAEHIYSDSSNKANFLTLAERPMIFDNWYFDLSFINSIGASDLVLVEDSYNEAGTLQTENWTLYNSVSNLGVLRLPITNRGNYYQNCYVTNAILIINASLWSDVVGYSSFVKGTNTLSFSASAFNQYYATQPVLGINSGNFNSISVTIVVSGTWDFSSPSKPFIQFGIHNSIGDGKSVVSEDFTANGTYSVTLTESDPASSSALFDKLSLYAQTGGYTSGTINVSITITPGYLISKGSNQYTETKRIDVNQNCVKEYIYLTWKNAKGGFDYWLFTAFKDYTINISETQSKDTNIFPTWEKAYDEFAEGLSYETSRKARREIIVRSQYLTRSHLEFISGIKTSALVQQLTSKYDRRTVKVDKSSFTVRKDRDKVFTIQFTIAYTDDIPSQSL